MRVGGRYAEQFSGVCEQLTVAGAEQAIIAHLDEAVGQDVLQEAAQELLSGKGTESDLLGG